MRPFGVVSQKSYSQVATQIVIKHPEPISTQSVYKMPQATHFSYSKKFHVIDRNAQKKTSLIPPQPQIVSSPSPQSAISPSQPTQAIQNIHVLGKQRPILKPIKALAPPVAISPRKQNKPIDNSDVFLPVMKQIAQQPQQKLSPIDQRVEQNFKDDHSVVENYQNQEFIQPQVENKWNKVIVSIDQEEGFDGRNQEPNYMQRLAYHRQFRPNQPQQLQQQPVQHFVQQPMPQNQNTFIMQPEQMSRNIELDSDKSNLSRVEDNHPSIERKYSQQRSLRQVQQQVFPVQNVPLINQAQVIQQREQNLNYHLEPEEESLASQYIPASRPPLLYQPEPDIESQHEQQLRPEHESISKLEQGQKQERQQPPNYSQQKQAKDMKQTGVSRIEKDKNQEQIQVIRYSPIQPIQIGRSIPPKPTHQKVEKDEDGIELISFPKFLPIPISKR